MHHLGVVVKAARPHEHGAGLDAQRRVALLGHHANDGSPVGHKRREGAAHLDLHAVGLEEFAHLGPQVHGGSVLELGVATVLQEALDAVVVVLRSADGERAPRDVGRPPQPLGRVVHIGPNQSVVAATGRAALDIGERGFGGILHAGILLAVAVGDPETGARGGGGAAEHALVLLDEDDARPLGLGCGKGTKGGSARADDKEIALLVPRIRGSRFLLSGHRRTGRRHRARGDHAECACRRSFEKVGPRHSLGILHPCFLSGRECTVRARRAGAASVADGRAEARPAVVYLGVTERRPHALSSPIIGRGGAARVNHPRVICSKEGVAQKE